MIESVKIQEERRKNVIMNSRAEYSRSTLLRLTAKMGEEEYDEKRGKEKKEDRIMEENIRREIHRRRKEICKERSQEIHEHQEKREITTTK